MRSVDTIIVTYGSARQIPSCLTSLAESDAVSRVIVVDNASSDGSAEAARRAGAVVIENVRNVGFARAVNIGLVEAGGAADPAGHILLLNPDARLGAKALRALCLAFEADPRVAVAGPLLRAEDGTLTAGSARTATLFTGVGQCVPVLGRSRRLRPGYRLPGDPDVLRATVDVGYLFGAAMLVDRRFLTACGGLDERFFLFAEDEDICRQARADGRRVVLIGRAEAAHVGGASSSDVPLTEAQRLFSTWRLFEKWDGRGVRRGITAASSRPSRRASPPRRSTRRPARASGARPGSSTRPCAPAWTLWSPRVRAPRRRPVP